MTQGSIYQDPVGTNFPPNPDLFDLFPTLEFDTYVAANGNTTNTAGAAGDVGGDVFQFDTAGLNVSWFDTATNDIGTINIGRFTLSDDDAEQWTLKIFNTTGDIFLALNVTFTHGELASPPPPPPLPPPPPPQAIDGDFTGDGKDDILWRNRKNGRNAVWQMDGLTFQSAQAIKRVRNTAWQVAGLADYTGDGVTDILWRHTRTGANTVWQMNNTTFQSAIRLPAQTDLDLQPAGPLLGLWEEQA